MLLARTERYAPRATLQTSNRITFYSVFGMARIAPGTTVRPAGVVSLTWTAHPCSEMETSACRMICTEICTFCCTVNPDAIAWKWLCNCFATMEIVAQQVQSTSKRSKMHHININKYTHTLFALFMLNVARVGGFGSVLQVLR